MTLQRLLGIELSIIQAPMAGVQDSALAVAVSNASGLGSLPCAMLSLDAIRNELAAIKAQTGKPFNVNFFCHAPPAPNGEREATWRAALSPYYKEYGIDADAIPVGPRRAPFGSEAADVLLPQVVRGVKVPVIAAGGIADAKGVAAGAGAPMISRLCGLARMRAVAGKYQPPN